MTKSGGKLGKLRRVLFEVIWAPANPNHNIDAAAFHELKDLRLRKARDLAFAALPCKEPRQLLPVLRCGRLRHEAAATLEPMSPAKAMFPASRTLRTTSNKSAAELPSDKATTRFFTRAKEFRACCNFS